MKYSLMKKDATTLASMDHDELVKTINSYVTGLYRKANAPVKVVKPSIDDPNYKEAFDDYVTAVAKKLKAMDEFEGYLEEQKALFRSKGLNGDMAFKNAIVPVGELPSGVQIMKIIKRGIDLTPIDDTENQPSVRLSEVRSMSTDRDSHRGKYNDAAMIINEAASCIDRSEYSSMSSM